MDEHDFFFLKRLHFFLQWCGACRSLVFVLRSVAYSLQLQLQGFVCQSWTVVCNAYALLVGLESVLFYFQKRKCAILFSKKKVC